MAGLFGLLGFLTLTGLNIKDSVEKDINTYISKESAQKLNKEIYYDAFRRPHWTETDEIVEIVNFQGCETIKGIKSNKIYKETKSKFRLEQEVREMKYKNGIEYCKNNNINYYPFYFPNSLIGKNSDFNTGLEINTNKKYCCIKINNQYILLYLEDNPHYYYQERNGYLMEYDAVHDKEGFLLDDNYCLNKRKEKGKEETWYVTKKILISKEEYLERTTELKEFPYEYYKLK